MKKLKGKYFTFVFASFMSLLMSGIISFCITLKQFGFTDDIFSKFVGAWQMAFPLAFVVAQFVAPIVRRITHKLVEET